MYYSVFTSPTCFPLPVAIGGSFSSTGTAITTNTSSSLSVGNYLYSTTNNQIRLITDIGTTGTTFTIDSAFTVDVTNDVTNICDTSVTYTKASVSNYDKVNALFNGQLFYKRSIIDIDGIIAFTIDGTGTTGISILAE